MKIHYCGTSRNTKEGRSEDGMRYRGFYCENSDQAPMGPSMSNGWDTDKWEEWRITSAVLLSSGIPEEVAKSQFIVGLSTT